MTMATKAATSTPTVQSEIDRIREEIRTHEVAILGLKQQLAEQRAKLPKSKMALAEELYLKHQDEPRAEVIKAFSNDLGLSVQVASSYYSTVKSRVARRHRAEESTAEGAN
jgi:predicted solute-binding protein